MSYTFDIIGVSPVLSFFYYQQQIERHPNRSQAYLGSYQCTLDAFLESTEIIPQKPNWDWDEAVKAIVNFWLKHEEKVRYWKSELETAGQENLIVGRVANFDQLRLELESQF